MADHTPLQQALATGMMPGADLSAELAKLGEYPIESSEDAQAACAALKQYEFALDRRDQNDEVLHPLASLFQDVATEEAFTVFHDEGIPSLLRIFDRLSQSPGESAEDLLFLLKIFVLYKSEEGAQRLVETARRGIEPDSYIWAVIFESFEEDHPHREAVCEGLRGSLPEDFCAVCYLDFVNQLAISGELSSHPFDSDEGVALLQRWLESQDPDEYSYGQSATAALPFLSHGDRDRLMSLAMDHPDERVQLEAAWASARLGSEGGIKSLARYCTDPTVSVLACSYLEELGRADAIPEEARDPDFVAMSEMCLWLSHPQEYGAPPDEIELFDKRVMYWPPTDDERPLWLFKYTYDADDENEEPDVGIGMVGSVTFALFGETRPSQSPEDIYALHCCWELEVNEDPRAPEERSIEAGRQILAEYQK